MCDDACDGSMLVHLLQALSRVPCLMHATNESIHQGIVICDLCLSAWCCPSDSLQIAKLAQPTDPKHKMDVTNPKYEMVSVC